MAQVNPNPREVWLRGPLPDMPPLVQPVAHALLQAQEELHTYLHDFPEPLLWKRPAGVASVGFHLQHLTGVLDRLFTYARRQTLISEQLDYLSAEGNQTAGHHTVASLLKAFDSQLEQSLKQLQTTQETTLTEPRGVGRAQLPSTVLGLLFHSAEHTQRHLGQLLVTVRILKEYEASMA